MKSLSIVWTVVAAAISSLVCMTMPMAVGAADGEYLVQVVSEAADIISRVRFGPAGARVEQEIPTGEMPADIDGPHGLAFSPDRQFYYVSLGHGKPFGSVWKYAVKNDAVIGRVTLGLFPASLDVSPDGSVFYVVNFNLHGDMVPSSVSIVATEPMIEIARVPTCTMPHGSRLNPQGTRHYSACMMDDQLVEIDTATLKVARRLNVATGEPAPAPALDDPHAGHRDPACSPTWAQPSSDGSKVYVACNKSSTIVEVDVAEWKVTRRLAAGPGVYNLAVSSAGRLVATNKRGQSVSYLDLSSGRELARLPTRRTIVHGVAISRDGRYAFVSVEGVGREPGTVEVIDLLSLKTVAKVDVAPQAAGIDVR